MEVESGEVCKKTQHPRFWREANYLTVKKRIFSPVFDGVSKMKIINVLFAVVVSGFLSTSWAGAAVKLDIQAVPAEPEVQAEEATATTADGGTRQLKPPHLAVTFDVTNKSDVEHVTIAKMAFRFSAGVDEDEEFTSFTLEPALGIPPGETKSTETFYLEGLPLKPGDRQRISVSVTGWKNSGADAGDQFATGTGFSTR